MCDKMSFEKEIKMGVMKGSSLLTPFVHSLER